MDSVPSVDPEQLLSLRSPNTTGAAHMTGEPDNFVSRDCSQVGVKPLCTTMKKAVEGNVTRWRYSFLTPWLSEDSSISHSACAAEWVGFLSSNLKVQFFTNLNHSRYDSPYIHIYKLLVLPSSAEEHFQRLLSGWNTSWGNGVILMPTSLHNSWRYRRAKTVHYESSIVTLLCIIPRENPNLVLSPRLMDIPLFTRASLAPRQEWGKAVKPRP